MEANGDIYLGKYAGWYSVRDEAYYDENETDARRRTSVRVGAAGHAGRMGRGGELFLPAVRLSGQAARPLRAQPGLHRCRRSGATRSRASSRAGCRICRSRAPPSTGASRCRAIHEHVMYVWVDALTNYITGVGFPDDRQREVQALLAGRSACHRQGHRALPRGLLAGLPDVGGHRAAEARLRPRLPVQPRREDVEVGRQRRRSVRARRRLRRRSGALFLPARSAVRPGRQLQPRGDRQPHQCRSRQRSRQSGAALAVDDRQELRRRAAGAGRVQRRTTRRSSTAADAHDRPGARGA